MGCNIVIDSLLDATPFRCPAQLSPLEDLITAKQDHLLGQVQDEISIRASSKTQRLLSSPSVLNEIYGYKISCIAIPVPNLTFSTLLVIRGDYLHCRLLCGDLVARAKEKSKAKPSQSLRSVAQSTLCCPYSVDSEDSESKV